MEKETNTLKYYRTVACVIGAMSIIILSFVLVFRTSFSMYTGIAVATIAGLLYPYVISGQLLKSRFQRLGSTIGKTPAEIAAVVGDADEISRIENEIVALAWTLSTYTVELEFSGGTCITNLRTADRQSRIMTHGPQD